MSEHEKQPARFGKYSKTIREMQSTINYLGKFCESEINRRDTEIERLRAIVRVNGLRWGRTHTEIDEILNQQETQEGK